MVICKVSKFELSSQAIEDVRESHHHPLDHHTSSEKGLAAITTVAANWNSLELRRAFTLVGSSDQAPDFCRIHFYPSSQPIVKKDGDH
ncbi:hypothetical protein L1987_47817 [Smallanthus sonchifolius]|uniref:Uncharacterized protein n=1 Tax=Smallanthus sonchifolius TaxID=185202 RepID=A0ACB9FRT8_9ASTR|nr:hypothetical protein L1987_47817 [Smallanthus sonchifolius]